MTQANKVNYQRYWEQNIEKWGSLYLEYSHGNEQLNSSAWLDWLYKKTIYRLESKLMKDRYQLTLDFVKTHVKPEMRFNDIGCGIGLFTVAALKQGAYVNAIDFSEVALAETKKRVETYAPECLSKVSFHHLNAEQELLPCSDVALAMGVTPYIQHLDYFYENVLQTSELFYCLVVDSEHFLNRMRRILPFLNVRNLLFYSKSYVNQLLIKNQSVLLSRKNFATGFMDLYQSQATNRRISHD